MKNYANYGSRSTNAHVPKKSSQIKFLTNTIQRLIKKLSRTSKAGLKGRIFH